MLNWTAEYVAVSAVTNRTIRRGYRTRGIFSSFVSPDGFSQTYGQTVLEILGCLIVD